MSDDPIDFVFDPPVSAPIPAPVQFPREGQAWEVEGRSATVLGILQDCDESRQELLAVRYDDGSYEVLPARGFMDASTPVVALPDLPSVSVEVWINIYDTIPHVVVPHPTRQLADDQAGSGRVGVACYTLVEVEDLR